MQKMSFRNKSNSQEALQTLTQALANRKKNVINTGTITPYQKTNNNNDTLSGAGEFLTGGLKLYNGLQNSGLLGGGNESHNIGLVGKSTNDYIVNKPDYGILGNAANDSIMGTGGTGSAISDAIGSEVGGGLGSVSPIGWLSLGQGALNGLNQGFNHEGKDILGGFGNGLQGFFGVDENDSDVKQGIKGTVDGALKGTAIFPGVGTVIGALLGLGSSFLDDI